MDSNIYKPPKAKLVKEKNQQDKHKFYIVAPKKFLVLYLATLGLYVVYWFYKNWQLYKRSTNNKLIPAMRAIFYVFFTHSLFAKINQELKNKLIESNWNPFLLATTFVIITIISSFIDTVSGNPLNQGITSLIGLAGIFISAWVLYQVQLNINLACASPDGEFNNQFTLANIAWIVLGCILWLMYFAGILLMVDHPFFNRILPNT